MTNFHFAFSWDRKTRSPGEQEAGVSLPGAIHLVRVTFHLDGDPGWGLRQPVLLRDAWAHLGCLSIVAGGGRGHVRLSQVWRPVGTLKQ